jgi:hypothetical protein
MTAASSFQVFSLRVLTENMPGRPVTLSEH